MIKWHSSRETIIYVLLDKRDDYFKVDHPISSQVCAQNEHVEPAIVFWQLAQVFHPSTRAVPCPILDTSENIKTSGVNKT